MRCCRNVEFDMRKHDLIAIADTVFQKQDKNCCCFLAAIMMVGEEAHGGYHC